MATKPAPHDRSSLPEMSSPHLRIKLAAPGQGRTRLSIFGDIGWDVRIEDILNLFQNFPEEKWHLDVFSPGGYAFDAMALYDFVRANGVDVTATGYGFVGSAATVIMAAAGRDNTSLGENTLYFIHHAWGGQDDTLDTLNDRLTQLYMDLTGLDRKTIEGLLEKGDEGWSMTAQEAVEMGFIGEVQPELARDTQAAAKAHGAVPPQVPETKGTRVTENCYLNKVMSKQTDRAGNGRQEAADSIGGLTEALNGFLDKLTNLFPKDRPRASADGLTEDEATEAIEQAQSIAEEARQKVADAVDELIEAKTQLDEAINDIHAKDEKIAELTEQASMNEALIAKVRELWASLTEGDEEASEEVDAEELVAKVTKLKEEADKVPELTKKVDALMKLPKAESTVKKLTESGGTEDGTEGIYKNEAERMAVLNKRIRERYAKRNGLAKA